MELGSFTDSFRFRNCGNSLHLLLENYLFLRYFFDPLGGIIGSNIPAVDQQLKNDLEECMRFLVKSVIKYEEEIQKKVSLACCHYFGEIRNRNWGKDKIAIAIVLISFGFCGLKGS